MTTEPFLSAEIEYRRERAMQGRSRARTQVAARPRRSPRTGRVRSLVHLFATGH